MIVADGLGVGLPVGLQSFGQVMVDVGSQQSPQLIYFGTEIAREGPVEVGGADRGAGRLLLRSDRALCLSGRARRWGGGSPLIDNRLLAYTADILGSLAGIAVFGLMSFFRLPALVWFAIALAIGVCFVPRRRLAACRGRPGRRSVLVAWATGPGTAEA